MTRPRVWLLVQTLVSAGLLVLLFRRLDWDTFAQAFRRISAPFYVASLLVNIVGQALYAWRWQIVLTGMGARVPFADVWRQHLVGVFFSNLMPTAVGGDAAKVFYLGRRVGYAEAGASVFVDRFVGFLWLSLLGAALAWTIDVRTSLFTLNRNLLTLFAAGFLGVLAVAWLAPVDGLLLALPQGRWAAWAARAADLVRLVRAGCCRPVTLVAAALIMAAYLTLLTTVYVSYFALSGTPVSSWLTVTSVLISMAVFVNVPISVNGIGLREQLHYLLFAALGVPREVAVSLSLLIFSQLLLVSAAGCLVWLRIRPQAAAAGR